MADYTKLQAGTNLGSTATAAWSPNVVPTTADNCFWVLASPLTNSSRGGTLTGNFGCNVLTFNGATVGATPTAVNHTGTLTLVGGITCTNTNNVYWGATGTTGAIAVGATTQTWTLFSTSFSPVQIFSTSANALTGTAASKITLVGLDTSNVTRNALYVTTACANFLGTIEVKDYAYLQPAGASAVLTGANFILGTNGIIGAYAGAARTLGAVGKTLTVEGDGRLGETNLILSLAPNVILAGAGTRTLTFTGATLVSGSVSTSTANAGVIVAGPSKYVQLWFQSTTSGMSGPCTVTGGSFVLPSTNRFVPTTLAVSANARFVYTNGSADYSFPVTPTGLGVVQIRGNFAGTGVTFPASGTGSVELFDGALSAMSIAASGLQTAKIVTHHLPGGLELVANASNATPAISSIITYVGAGQTRATSITVDSEVNTQAAALTAGTYSLVSSGAGPIVLSGPVQRTNSTAGGIPTASARMDLSLGGTNSGDNTLSGNISEAGANGATLGIRKVDTGRWVLGGNNSHTGTTTVVNGTLALQSNSALGSSTTGGITLSGGVLQFKDGRSITKTSGALTFGGGALEIDPNTGSNSLTCSGVTLNTSATINVAEGSSLALNNSGAIIGADGITKNGDGDLTLATFNNTYTGAININSGSLTVSSLNSQSTNGVLGNSATAITLKGRLKYTGSSASSTNRSLTLTGPSPILESSGDGSATYLAATQTNEARTLTLTGTSIGDNTVAFSIQNSTQTTGLTKSGTGKWILGGATLSYSGATLLEAGTLDLGGTSRVLSGGLSMSGGTLQNGSATLETDVTVTAGTGAITAQLVGAGNLDVTGGMVTLTQSDSNTYTGGTTIGAGATLKAVTSVDPSAVSGGKVLGDGTVTVTGTLKTGASSTQRGQLRYGGTVTFNGGSKIYVGGA